MNEFTRIAMELAEEWLDEELKCYRGLRHTQEAARSALLAHLEGGEQRDGPGTPAGRFQWLLDELHKRFPDPEPYSARAYEGRFLAWLDRLPATPTEEASK